MTFKSYAFETPSFAHFLSHSHTRASAHTFADRYETARERNMNTIDFVGTLNKH